MASLAPGIRRMSSRPNFSTRKSVAPLAFRNGTAHLYRSPELASSLPRT